MVNFQDFTNEGKYFVLSTRVNSPDKYFAKIFRKNNPIGSSATELASVEIPESLYLRALNADDYSVLFDLLGPDATNQIAL